MAVAERPATRSSCAATSLRSTSSSPENARRRIDALTQPAVRYPFWHRAMDPAEAPYLDAYATTVKTG